MKNILILGLTILLFASCGKENEQIDYNTGVLASQEYVESQQIMDLLLNTYFKRLIEYKSKRTILVMLSKIDYRPTKIVIT